MHPAPELSGARSALVIATATYADPGLSQLRAPAQDAIDMGDVLADPDIGGFTVTRVVDRPEYEIRRSAAAFLAGRTVDELVVVYLSCHGVLDARGRLYFAATDTEKDQLSSTAVESSWLLDRLEECRARRQVLILDCCFSGAFARTKGGTEVDLERRLIGAGRGRAVLTASRAGEYSYEGDPLADGADAGSVFTAGLIDGLRSGSADRDRDGYITVEDAYAYAAEHVQTRGGAQSPQRWLFGGEDAIVLARNPRGAVVTAAALPDALQLSLDSPYPEIRRAAVSTLGTWLNSKEPGQVLAAQQTLQTIASQDSPTVAAAAREILVTANITTPPEPERAQPRQSEPTTVTPRHLVATIKASKKWFLRSIVSVVFSPDGRLLASGGEDETVRLWDVATRQQVGEPLTGHTNCAWMVAFSPDGRLLASCGDETVRLWDVATHRLVGTPLTGHVSNAGVLAFSPDGRMLASGGMDMKVRLWDPATGEPARHPLIGHTNWVVSLAFSPDGRLLASGSEDSTLRLWDPHTGQQVGDPLAGHTDNVWALAFSPDGRLLASGGKDSTVRLWDPDTGQPAGIPLTGHEKTVASVAFSPDGSLLASASEDKTVRLWDPATGRQIGDPLTGHTQMVRSVAFSPDGRLLASASVDGTIRLWSTEPVV